MSAPEFFAVKGANQTAIPNNFRRAALVSGKPAPVNCETTLGSMCRRSSQTLKMPWSPRLPAQTRRIAPTSIYGCSTRPRRQTLIS